MTSEALAPLVGARIRRIDLPGDDLAALSVSLDAGGGSHLSRVLLFSLSTRVPGLGLVEERPHGAPASAFCQLLRKHLEGAVVVGAEAGQDGVTLRLRRGPEKAELALAPGLLALVLGQRRHVHKSRDVELLAAPRWLGTSAETLTALEDAGAGLLAARDRGDRDDETVLLLRALRALAKRLEARRAAVRRDFARTDEIPSLRLHGTLLLSSLASIPRGASSVTLIDHGEDPPREVLVTLDPARDPREQARALFDRARKLERGAAVSSARLAETTALLEQAHALTLALARPDASDANLTEARTFLDAHATRGTERSRRGRAQPREPRLPYRRLLGHDGREIRVGRGARDNDELTQKHAAPHDLWLHARGVPGAHVVVPLAKGETCPPELLLDAATLAAHFSDLTNERVVEVDHVARGKVRKRKGMAPGKVEVDHPKTIAVRMEPARVARLLGKK